MATETQVKPVWKCKVEGCDYTTPGTSKGYWQISGHQLRHATEGVPKENRGFCLVDEKTGETLAEKLTEAKEKGLVKPEPEQPEPPKPEQPELKPEPPKPELKPEPEPPKPELKPEPEPPKPEEEGKERKEKGEKEITTPQVSSEGIFRYTISLPADAFTLYHLAIGSGLEKDSDKPFEEWVWDCIKARFSCDYKHRLILAPMEEE